MDYITIAQAAKSMGVSYYALWCATQRRSLQAVKINKVLHTTEGWLTEYRKNSRNKEIVSRFNGRKTFDPRYDEFSTKKVAKLLGIKKQRVYWLIYTGQLKTIRKGSYHVITQDSLNSYLNKTEVFVHEAVV